MITVRPVQQPNNYACGITCISMVSGIPLEKLKLLWPLDKPMGPEDMDSILDSLNIPYVRRLYPRLYPHRTCIVTVPSLNFESMLHFIVIQVRESTEHYTIYDPNEGRPNKKSYGAYINLLSYAEVVEIG